MALNSVLSLNAESPLITKSFYHCMENLSNEIPRKNTYINSVMFYNKLIKFSKCTVKFQN